MSIHKEHPNHKVQQNQKIFEKHKTVTAIKIIQSRYCLEIMGRNEICQQIG